MKERDAELQGAALRDRVAELPRRFSPPAELTSSRPRDTELTAAGRAVYVVAIVMFAVAIVGALLLNRELQRQHADQRAFETNGISGTAEVTRLWRGSDDSKQPWVAYRYVAGTGQYEGKSKLRLATWRGLQEGSPLAISYLSNDPARSHLAGVDPRSMPAWVPVIVGLSVASAAIVLFVLLNGQRRLLAEGRPAPALVTRLAKHQTSHGGSHRSIRYAFPLLSGSMATGKSEARKGQAVGMVICVVYDPDRPRRSQPYPFPLVRPAKLAR